MMGKTGYASTMGQDDVITNLVVKFTGDIRT